MDSLDKNRYFPENLLSQTNKPYTSKKSVATLAFCSFLLTNAVATTEIVSSGTLNLSYSDGINCQIVDQAFYRNTNTWSDITVKFSPSMDEGSDVANALIVLKGLSFLDGDAEAELEADKFFSKIPVKKRKIFTGNKV